MLRQVVTQLVGLDRGIGPDEALLEFGVALQLTMPPEHLFTHRVWLGCVGVLCQLEATVAVRPEIERWLPGFDAAV